MSWFINERGMMFGNRINIIDLFVLSVILLIIMPMLWFGYKVKKNLINPRMLPKTTIEIKIEQYENMKLQITKQQKEIELITAEKNRKENQIKEYLKEYKREKNHFPE